MLKQQADEVYQSRDQAAAVLSRAGLSGTARSVNGKSPIVQVEAWMSRLDGGEEPPASRPLEKWGDKDRMIEELRSEVKRTKDKYYTLKSYSRSPPVHYPPFHPTTPSHHHQHHSHSHPHHLRKAPPRRYDSHAHASAMVVSDADGNVVMDPDNVVRTVEELQDKVKKIKRYLPDYVY